MRVLKRIGQYEPMLFDKITERLAVLSQGLNVSPDKVAQKAISSMTDGISTSIIDEITADVAVNMITEDPDYETLAVRIIVSNMHKLKPGASEVFESPFDEMIVPERDYEFSYFGIKTLLKMFLNENETPQYMFMRVAIGIHGKNNIEAVKETYDYMSQKYFTHATPTLFNAGTKSPQLSSCFLTGIKEDSIAGMYDTLKDCALISKWSGGLGIHIHNVRAKGSHIRGTNGTSDGIIPMLRTFNATARHVNQSGKRKGSFAIYLEPWHADVFDFLELRLNQGDEEARTRDLFTALWIPDLFMKRLETNQPWSLFCPDKAPGLQNIWGEEFEKLYLKYEAEGRASKTVPIQQLWSAILKSQIETGTPYMLYKDACNSKSNQQHLGTIKSSNLCVAPETKILTRKGYIKISDLCDQEVEIWNGEEWSFVNVKKTSTGSKLIRVNFTAGSFIECTEYHKFHLNDGSIKDAKDLIPGDSLIQWINPYDYYIMSSVEVVSVEDNRRVDDTYCFNEPKRHMGIFNGVIAGNCTEIVEHTNPEEIAVCNLASICLPKFVDGDFFDFELLEKVTRIVTRNLDKVIDINMYPVPEAEYSNNKHRPVAIGVQGLADVYQLMGLEFGQGDLNKKIFETMYWAACSESVELAKTKGPHTSFEGSPWSQGLFQFDLWGQGPVTDRYDWESIRGKPIRNSLLLGPMPTATTSQIMGNNECFEPYTSNMYLRRTLAGEFVILNKHLVRELKSIGRWNKDIKDHIIRDQGSIQSIEGLPESMKRRFRTVWEIPQKTIIDMAAERGPFICQSQSMNLHVEDPSINKLSSMHMYAWKKGLKTGMYYLRTRPKARAIQFTLEPMVCRKENGCVMCSA